LKNRSSSLKSAHQLNFHNKENGSAVLEVLFTFVAQLFLSLGVIIFFTQVAHADVMSFQEWKKLKVDEAQIQTKATDSTTTTIQASGSDQASSSVSSSTSTSSPSPVGSQSTKTKTVKPKTEASKLALQIAQELTIEDYFALYLSQFKDRNDFIDAAKKLTSSELGDLLLNLKSSLSRETSQESIQQNLSFSTLGSAGAATKK